MKIQPLLSPPLTSPQTLSTISDQRVRQIALVFFTSLSFGLGVLALSVGTATANFVAFASFSAAGTLIWIISKIKQYDSPHELARYQKEAKSMSFDEIIKEHGWENSFRYEIPKKELFEKKFLKSMETRSVFEIVSIYEKASELITKTESPFTLPSSDVFKAKFNEETSSMTACEICKSYDIEKLHNLGIASNDLFETNNKYIASEANHKEDVETVKKEFSSKCKDSLSTFSSILHQTTTSKPSETNWVAKLKREAEHLKAIEPSTWHHSSTDILKLANVAPDESPESSMKPLHLAHIQFVNLFESAKSLLESSLQELDRAREKAHQSLNKEYD